MITTTFCIYNNQGVLAIHDERSTNMMRILCILIFLCLLTGNLHAQDAFTHAQNQFALKIYQQAKPDNANFFISPLSVNIALAMLMEGAAGETREELATLLGVEEIDSVSTLYPSLFSKLQQEQRLLQQLSTKEYGTPKSNLVLSNSLWYNTKLAILPAYATIARDYYHAELFGYSDAEVGTVQNKINAWVREKTNQRITSLPSPLDAQTKLTVLNATYFMAEWETKFDKDLTEKREFTSLDNTSKDIDFMYTRRLMRYYENDDIQAISLPYRYSSLC